MRCTMSRSCWTCVWRAMISLEAACARTGMSVAIAARTTAATTGRWRRVNALCIDHLRWDACAGDAILIRRARARSSLPQPPNRLREQQGKGGINGESMPPERLLVEGEAAATVLLPA